MHTVDFQAEIGPAGPGAYQVTLRAPDGAETSADGVRLPAGAEELRILTARIPDAILASSAVVRRSAPPEERPVQELGRILFDLLLAGEGRALFAAARHRAADADRSLRLVLRVRPPELARLPWEFLFDSGENMYVCTTMPLVRRPQVATPQRPLVVAAPLRILCMAARPDDLEPLAVQAERDRLVGALAGLREAGLIELGWVEGETWRALRTALTRRGPWHILHFIGHGGFDPVAQEGTLALAGEEGGTYQLGAENLAMMLHAHRSLRLVVLNACETGRSAAADPFSSMGGALLRAGVPAVLAMQYAISDRAAVEFGRTFYEGLAHRLPVDAAVTEARQAIRLALPGTLEWGTPVLFMRAAEGVLFEVAEPVAEMARAEAVRPVTEPSSAPAPAQVPAPVRPEPEPARPEPEPLRGEPESPRTEPGDPLARFRLAGLGGSPARAPQAGGPAGVAGPAPARPEGRRFRRRFTGPPPRITRVSGPRGPVSLAFSGDSGRLAIGGGGWTAVVVDRAGGRVCRVRSGGYLAEALDAVKSSFMYQEVVLDVSFDAAGETFATVAGGSVRVWHTASGSLVEKRSLGNGSSLTAAVAEGGRVAATVHHGVVTLSEAGGPKRTILITELIRAVAFSPDGTWFAAAGHPQAPPAVQFTGLSGGNARVWGTRSGDEVLSLPHTDAVDAVAFSPDSTRLATASGKTVHVWEFPAGGRVLELAQSLRVSDLAFGPDGTTLATAHASGATVWDLRNGGLLWEHRSPPEGPKYGPPGVRRVAYSRDGTLLAVIEGPDVLLLDLTRTP
ncbi:CHAT domain-containing protein [Streptomyces sp. N35]|uniref:CHAT domain-containing WD40 repeat protein n=1 Tax=Streptomyces sp. N35 TaxID=2795730 RepID=UPI0018F38FDF|nr:CHAT domain-containing protein [Streptomyces sp. N35]